VFRERANTRSILAIEINALRPLLSIGGKFRVMAKYLRYRTHLPKSDWLAIIGHHDHFTKFLLANLLDKVAEVRAAGDI
jgi:hypothetical protein